MSKRTKARNHTNRLALALRLVAQGLPLEAAARRASISEEQVRKALGTKHRLSKGEDDMTNEPGKTVKLVDADTGAPLDVPGGLKRLQASPDWSNAGGTWRYVGPLDEHGYPANDPWLAHHRYEERLSAYEERLRQLDSTPEGYREAQLRAEREGITLSEAINALANEAYPAKPQPGVRGGAAQPITDELIRERAEAFELSERDAINSLMLDGYEL